MPPLQLGNKQMQPQLLELVVLVVLVAPEVLELEELEPQHQELVELAPEEHPLSENESIMMLKPTIP